jgi:NitT/TauT family transport system substrate-binding protein
MAYVTRRSALTIVAGGVAMAGGRVRAEDSSGRVIYPVAVPVYQTQFLATAWVSSRRPASTAS